MFRKLLRIKFEKFEKDFTNIEKKGGDEKKDPVVKVFGEKVGEKGDAYYETNVNKKKKFLSHRKIKVKSGGKKKTHLSRFQKDKYTIQPKQKKSQSFMIKKKKKKKKKPLKKAHSFTAGVVKTGGRKQIFKPVTKAFKSTGEAVFASKNFVNQGSKFIKEKIKKMKDPYQWREYTGGEGELKHGLKLKMFCLAEGFEVFNENIETHERDLDEKTRDVYIQRLKIYLNIPICRTKEKRFEYKMWEKGKLIHSHPKKKS